MNEATRIKELLKMFLRTNKPWKKRGEIDTKFYDNGWNDCLKELQKNADKWFKKYDKDFMDKSTLNR